MNSPIEIEKIMELNGKRLLFLGANSETAAIIETAKKMGIYTLVTDYDPTAPAKKIADKSFNVDGFDVPGLIALAKSEKVDGVLVGVADSLIEKYQQVCKALGFPCYATAEQVKYFTNKYFFKQKCTEYGILGVPEYDLDKPIPKSEFPIVIKPADSNSGNGMTIIESSDEIPFAVKKAMSVSRMKKVLAEKYMGSADDVSIYYTFQNGQYYLSSFSDRYTSGEQGNLSRVCLGDVFPSKLIKTFLEDEHPKYLRMFSGLDCRDGIFYISAFYEKGKFYVYDPGYRLQGGGFHLIVNAANNLDHREMLVRYALTGIFGIQNIDKINDPYLRGKSAAVIWFLLKSGRISKIDGLDYINKHPDVVSVLQRFNVGGEVVPGYLGTEKQVFARLCLLSVNEKALESSVAGIEENLRVYDENGNNMLLSTLNIKKILFGKVLDKKTVIISGGTKGVGKALAVECAVQGANVVVAGRDEKAGYAVVAEMTAKGGCGEFVRTDLNDIAQIRHLFSETQRIFGKIDGYVNYAGITPIASLTDCNEEIYNHVFNINVKAAFFSSQEAIYYMCKSGGGSIVLVGSAHAWSGQKDRAAYAVSKGALLTLMEHIAHQYANKHIRCNTITLGWTPTEGELEIRASQGISEDELKEAAAKILPMGRMPDLSDPIPAFIYYLSDQSELVTGSNIRVTAGEYI